VIRVDLPEDGAGSEAWLQSGDFEADIELDRTRQGALFVTTVPVDNNNSIERLVANGFVLTDTAVTLQKATQQVVQDPTFVQANSIVYVEAKPSDEESTVRLAEASYVYSRFHSDPLISDSDANRIYAEWTRNYFKGERGDKLLLAKQGDEVVGYLLLIRSEVRNAWIIDLIAVSPDLQKGGIAEKLCRISERLYTDCDYREVGTQLKNIPAIRLYEKLGYRIIQAAHTFHKHEPC